MYTYKPNGVRNLLLCLRSDRQQEAVFSYHMSGLRRLVYGVCGKHADFPPFNEYMNGLRSHIRPKDTRTAMDVVRDLLTALEGSNESIQ